MSVLPLFILGFFFILVRERSIPASDCQFQPPDVCIHLVDEVAVSLRAFYQGMQRDRKSVV